MHLAGRHDFSTFRLSLGAILANARHEAEIDEDRLTTWMHQHLRVVTIPVHDADALNELETEVLQRLDPPLNLDNVEKKLAPETTQRAAPAAPVQDIAASGGARADALMPGPLHLRQQCLTAAPTATAPIRAG